MRITALVVAALSFGESARGTITDIGDVVLTGNDLVIGNTADGSRTIDAEADGPYDEVRIAVAGSVIGALNLDHAASFTAGTLLAGVDGDALIELDNGSALTSGSAALDSAQIELRGGSTWVNEGALTYYGPFPPLPARPSISISGGSGFSTQGVALGGTLGPSSGLNVTIEGPGSSWVNEGALNQVGSASFSVLAGATARDDGVQILSSTIGHMSAFVDGAGSTWDTGAYRFQSNLTSGASLYITNGGRVNSTSALLGDIVSLIDFRVDGPGSIWSIAGPVVSKPESGLIQITNGGVIESGSATFCCQSALWFGVTISGSGSRWSMGGDLEVRNALRGVFAVEAGGNLLVDGDSIFSGWLGGCLFCAGAGPSIRDAGSLFRTNGSLTVDEFGTRLVAGDGGRIEVGGSFTQGSPVEFTIVLGEGESNVDDAILEVLGAATLAGTLKVELAAGYTPSLGDVFEVLIAGSLVGEFASYAGLDLGGGLYLVPEYRPDSFALRAVPEPTTGALVAAGLVAFAVARRRV